MRKASLILCVLFAMLFAFVERNTGLLLLFAVTASAVFIDAMVVDSYLQRIAVAKESQTFLETFFIEGSTWKYLGSKADRVDQTVRELKQRAAPYPGLQEKVLKTLRAHGITSALDLLERAENRKVIYRS
ncbi:MAG: hypothetical protein NUV60_00065 [Patescibacteria group bacterium]|nr:hypothetical protein [Patescibacteria group bacterium]